MKDISGSPGFAVMNSRSGGSATAGATIMAIPNEPYIRGVLLISILLWAGWRTTVKMKVPSAG
jgi:hypothetical protein